MELQWLKSLQNVLKLNLRCKSVSFLSILVPTSNPSQHTHLRAKSGHYLSTLHHTRATTEDLHWFRWCFQQLKTRLQQWTSFEQLKDKTITTNQHSWTRQSLNWSSKMSQFANRDNLEEVWWLIEINKNLLKLKLLNNLNHIMALHRLCCNHFRLRTQFLN